MSDVDSHNLVDTFLERLLSEGENLEVEFKSAQGGLPISLWETVSAFANTQGGWIVLGISDKRAIEGLSHASGYLDKFHSIMNNPAKISQSVCDEKEASIERWGDKDVIVIRIREVPRHQKPIYINNNPIGGTFVRRHTGDYVCKKPEVERMLREASLVGADSFILEGFTLADLDAGSLTRYRQRFQNNNPTAPRNNYDDLKFLTSIGGYKIDRITGQTGLTVAGLLMFGTEISIHEWRSRHMIDYRLIPDDKETENRWSERIVWEGNLFDGFDAISARLMQGLVSGFQLQGIIRIDESSVHVVLREALVNLFVHADYKIPEPSLILRSPSEFYFRNPGSSRISEADLFHGDRSDPRNPDLVRMFRFIGLAEEAGSGMPKIIQSWRKLGLELPIIDIGTEQYQFVLRLRQAHLLGANDWGWLRKLGSHWNEAEQLALVHVKHHGEIDNASLAKLTGMHPADVSRVLVSLRDRQFLERRGTGRPVKYEAGARLTIKPLVARKPDSPLISISPDVWERLLEMGEPMRFQAPVKLEMMKDMIVQLCAQAPLSSNELAVLVGRKRHYLQERIISVLVKSKRLRFLYPQAPNSQNQRYIAETNEDFK
jgi:ATP-dependent DNA helicase RecG